MLKKIKCLILNYIESNARNGIVVYQKDIEDFFDLRRSTICEILNVMEKNKTYLIGLDIGTSSVKGVLISTDGKERFTARSEFNYTYNNDGTVEIPAKKYINACYSMFRQLMKSFPQGASLAGICAVTWHYINVKT